MPSLPVPKNKRADLGPEDLVRKEKMIAVLKARGLLTASAEKFIRSGRR